MIKNFNFKSVKTKIAVWTGASLILLSVVIITYSVFSIRSSAITAAKEKVTEIAQSNSHSYKSELEYALTIGRALAQSFSINTTNMSERISRDYANKVLKQSIIDNPKLFGNYVAFEPNSFDGKDAEYLNDASTGSTSKGLFAPWWYRDDNKIVMTPCSMDDIDPNDETNWYIMPKVQKKEIIFNPTVWENGAFCVDILIPIITDGTFQGLVGEEIEIAYFQEMADIDIYNNTGTLMLISNNGTIAAATRNSDIVGKKITEVEHLADLVNEKDIGKGIVEYSKGIFKVILPFTVGTTETPWAVMVTVPDKEVLKDSNRALWALTIISILCVIATLSVVWYISSLIVKPLKEIVGVGKEIGVGVFPEAEIIEVGEDEVTELAHVFNNIVRGLKKKGEELERIASGDLTVDVTYLSEKDEFARIFDKMLNALNDSLGQVQIATEQLSIGSDDISQNSQSLADGASTQASSLEEISASLHEISARASENADNAVAAQKMAEESRMIAEKGNEQISALVGGITKISESIERIQIVTRTIEDIAFQTNLLALNAAVEAARAGQYGKGFAVVAEEVRNLATRSADSVKSTAQMVEEVISNTASGTEMVEKTAVIFESILKTENEINSSLENITGASNDQALGLNEINTTITELDTITQGNAASAEENASTSEELSAQAATLRAMVKRFNLR